MLLADAQQNIERDFISRNSGTQPIFYADENYEFAKKNFFQSFYEEGKLTVGFCCKWTNWDFVLLIREDLSS